MPPKRFNFALFELSFSPWLKKNMKFDDLKYLQNTLISHYLNDLFHDGGRKFWKFMTWMPPKCFNFALFEWSFSPWLIKILKFDDLKYLQNTLIPHYLNDLFHNGWIKVWNFMTWMPPKRFSFTLFALSSSPWLKKILKFDDLNASKKF